MHFQESAQESDPGFFLREEGTLGKAEEDGAGMQQGAETGRLGFRLWGRCQ